MAAQSSAFPDVPVSVSPPALDYPPYLQLVRRQPVSRLGDQDGTALDWLMSGAAASAGPAELKDGVIARLSVAGHPIERATLNLSTLHPQLLGITANWRGDLGICDEVQVNAHVRETSDYLTSPLRLMIEEGRSIRMNPQHPEAGSTYPIMKTLAAGGFTDYWGFPLKRAELSYTLLTLATRQAGGFSRGTLGAVQALLPAFALNVEIVSRGKIAEHVLDAYLGQRIGKRVLAGEIKRGFGETIDAVIWVSDMRNFTSLSDRIDSTDMVALLNAFFERLVDAVHGKGGEVLKFVGDGMLAIFPISDAQPPAAGLDFTVIGPAVNLTARVEPLSKETGRRLLLTDKVAELIAQSVHLLGDFVIRGVAHPVALFAAAEDAA